MQKKITLKKITLEEAVSRLKKVAESRLPEGSILEPREPEGFSIRCEPAWAIDAYLLVAPWIDGRPGKTGVFKPRVTVTWSSSSVSPAVARAAAKLHAEMADLACLLEAVVIGLPEIKSIGEE